MPAHVMTPTAEASFLAYLSYLEDLAGVLGGRYGFGLDGVYQTMQLHPPVRELSATAPTAAATARMYGHLVAAWTRLSAVTAAVDGLTYHRQANAVVPGLALEAVASAAGALAVAWDGRADDDDDALAFLGARVAEGLFPYPWSAFCAGCPQLGETEWGGSALPAAFVSVFSLPDPRSSDARLAMLLRTTRTRLLDERFARERQTEVRPGCSRRNLTREHKTELAEATGPTTLFDVFSRLRARVERDDGEAFTEAPYDDTEARRFATALGIVADMSTAAIEGLIVQRIGQDVFADLLGGAQRRVPAAAQAAEARLRALPPVQSAGYSRPRHAPRNLDA